MQQKSVNRQCRIHQQECIAIDMNPKCEFEDRYYCVKCLNNPIKAKHSFSFQDADEYMFKVKKIFKFSKEELNKKNADILRELVEETSNMKQSSDKLFDQLIGDLRNQIQIIENESSIIDSKLYDLDLESYLSSKFEFCSQKLEIQGFSTYINQYSKSILQGMKQFTDKLGELDDQMIQLIPEVPQKESEKTNIKKKPKLSFLCAEHEEEMRIYDQDESIKGEDRIICDECSLGRKGPFTPITAIYKLWEDDKNKKISIINQQQAIFDSKVKIAQDQISIINAEILMILQQIPNKILLFRQEQQQSIQNEINKIRREWSALNKNEVSQFADMALKKEKKNEQIEIENKNVYFLDKIIEFLNNMNQSQQGWSKQISSLQKNLNEDKTDRQQKIEKKSIIQSISMEYQLKQVKKEQQITANYQIIGENLFQKEFCYAIAIDSQSQTVVAGCNNNMRIFEFKKGQLQQIQFLTDHRDYVSTLLFLKNTKQFISGSGDGQMRIYGYNNNILWHCQQLLKDGHINFVAQILTTKQENALFSCSGDQKIKFWTIKEDCECSQTLQVHTQPVQGISLNQSETQLVSCGQDKQVIVFQPGFKNRWSVFQIIKVDQFGYRISYINDHLIAFQPLNTVKMDFFEYDERTKMFVHAKKNNACINFFPMQYNQAKKILIKKSGQSIDFIKVQSNGEYIIEQTIPFDDHNIWGTLSDDGEYLITWDFATKQFQVRKQM